MKLSLRSRFLLQAFVPLLFMTLFGAGTASWITVSQHRQLVYDRLNSNLEHLESQLNQSVDDFNQTLASVIHDRDIIRSVKLLYEYSKDETPELKRGIQNKIVQMLQAVIHNKAYDFIALYGPENLYAYATPEQIYIVTTDQSGNIQHYVPASPSARIRFTPDLWKTVPNAMPLNIKTDSLSVSELMIKPFEDYLQIQGTQAISTKIYDTELEQYRKIPIGAIVMQKNTGKNFMSRFSRNTGSLADIFSSSNKFIAGSHSNIKEKVEKIISRSYLSKNYFTDAVLPDSPFYILIRPFMFQNRTAAIMASYISKEPVYRNIKRLIALQTGGLLMGLIIAFFITLLTIRIITRQITLITRQMRTIAHEKRFDREVEVTSTDEIGMLADSFNQMVRILEQRNTKINKYINELSEINLRLEESEKKYRSIFENAVEGIFQATQEGRILSSNPAAAKIIGYDSPEKMFLSGLKITDRLYVNPEDRRKLKKIIAQYGKVSDFKTCIRRENGESVWVSVSARKVQYANENILECFINDISERIKKEAAEKERNEANAASKAKSEFLAGMSHEIRTPLNAILGFSELLISGIENPKHKNYLNTIYSSGQTLLALINDILDLSKIEAGKLELQPEFVDMARLITEVTRIFSQKAEQKGLLLKTEISQDLPAELLADEIRIRQILINLMGNAVKFTSKGYVKISLNCNYTDITKTHCNLDIKVEDTGIGIPADQHDLIFDSFYQQKGQKVSKYGGTGLGLAITKKLVQMMGGSIEVKSSQEKGSLFSVFLPDMAVLRQTETSTPDKPSEEQDIQFEPATILVVDDVFNNRELIKGYLPDSGLSIAEADSGDAALDYLNTRPKPGLILMDIRMPGKDGCKTTQIIKTDPESRHIPVIALTASGIKEIPEEILSLFDSYIRKPVTRIHLVTELKKYLPQKQSAKDNKCEQLEKQEDTGISEQTNQSDFMEELEHKIMPVWETINEMFFIDDIANFANSLETLAGKYQIQVLSNYSRELSEHTKTNNIDAIEILMKKFPEIVGEIKVDAQ